MKTIGERLKKLRLNAGMTQEQVASVIKKSKGNISGYENGTYEPSASTIIDLAKCFDISTDFILIGTDTLPNTSPNTTLNDDENELLNNYKKLDSRGRHTTHSVIYKELDRMKTQAAFQRDDDESDISSEGDLGVSGLGYDSFMVTNGAKKR